MSNLLQKTINNACRKWLLPQAASGFRLLGRRLISTSGPRCPELASSCRSQFSSGLFSVVHTGTGSAGSFQLCLQGKMEIVISFPNYFPPFYTYVKFSPRLVHFPRIDDLRIAGVLGTSKTYFRTQVTGVEPLLDLENCPDIWNDVKMRLHLSATNCAFVTTKTPEFSRFSLNLPARTFRNGSERKMV